MAKTAIGVKVAGNTIASADFNAVVDTTQNASYDLDTLSVMVGGTSVISSARNIANVGTVGCGAITSTGAFSATTGAFSGASVTIGTASTTTGTITFYNSTNANTVAFQAGASSASKTYTLPLTDGNSGQVLSTDGSAVLSWTNNEASTLQEAFDLGQTITIADTDNQVLLLTQNDVTNNPNAMEIVNTGTGSNLFVDVNGNTTNGGVYIEGSGTTGKSLHVYSDQGATQVDYLVKFHADNSGWDVPVFFCMNDGTGLDEAAQFVAYGTAGVVKITPNGNCASTSYGALNIINTVNTGLGLRVYTNIGATAVAPLVWLKSDNAAFDQVVLSVEQDNASYAAIAATGSITSTSTGLFQGASVTIGTSSTTTGGIILYNSTNANTTTIQAGAAAAALTFTWPTTDGNNTEVLQTDGNGVLSWVAAGGGGGTLDTAYDFGGAGAGRTITVANGAVELNQTATSSYALYVHRDLASGSTDSPLVYLLQDNAGDDQDVLSIQNDGTNSAIQIDQIGTTTWGINVATAYYGISVTNTGAGYAMYLQNTIGAGAGAPVVYLAATDGAFDWPVLTIVNAGVESAINIDQNGAATNGALFIENTGNTSYGMYLYTNIGATANAPLVFIEADNAAFDQPVLTIQQDGVSNGINIDQNGAAAAITIAQSAAGYGIYIGMTGAYPMFGMSGNIGNGATYFELGDTRDNASQSNYIYRDIAAAHTAGPVVHLRDVNAGDDQPVLLLTQNGSGLFINGAGASAPTLTNLGAWTDAPSFSWWKQLTNTKLDYLEILDNLTVGVWTYKDEVIDGINRYERDKNYRHGLWIDELYNLTKKQGVPIGTGENVSARDEIGFLAGCIKELRTENQELKEEIKELKAV